MPNSDGVPPPNTSTGDWNGLDNQWFGAASPDLQFIAEQSSVKNCIHSKEQRFEPKTATQFLETAEREFGLAIAPWVKSAHETLWLLQRQLRGRLARSPNLVNPFEVRVTTRLYFEYMRRGHALLDSPSAVQQLLDDLVHRQMEHKTQSAPADFHRLDAAAANRLLTDHHFLGYGRKDAALYVGKSTLTNIAVYSPWDLHHANRALDSLELDKSEVLVLSRLLNVPGTPKSELSKFIAQSMRWVRKMMPQIKAILTYVNPNIGHYGIVYRGANFLPLCIEHHPFYLFLDCEYKTPRSALELYAQHGVANGMKIGSVPPLPHFLLWYPLRMRAGPTPLLAEPCTLQYPADIVSSSPVMTQPHAYEVKAATPYNHASQATTVSRIKSNSSHQKIDIGQSLARAHNDKIKILARARERESDNIKGVAKNFENMSQDDIFVYVSDTTTPFEMRETDVKLKRIIANGILRGATFLYVRPTSNYMRRLGRNTEIQSEFQNFLDKVLSYLAEDDANLPRNRLLLVQTDTMPFFSISGSKWDLFLSSKIGSPAGLRGDSLIPAGHSSELEILLPQSAATATQLLSEVVQAADAVNQHVSEKQRIPSDVLVRLKDIDERARRQKLAI
jgi:hypothetical protein